RLNTGQHFGRHGHEIVLLASRRLPHRRCILEVAHSSSRTCRDMLHRRAWYGCNPLARVVGARQFLLFTRLRARSFVCSYRVCSSLLAVPQGREALTSCCRAFVLVSIVRSLHGSVLRFSFIVSVHAASLGARDVSCGGVSRPSRSG